MIHFTNVDSMSNGEENQLKSNKYDMAYFVYCNQPKYIRFLKNLLKKNSVAVLDSEFPECIITMRDPSQYIPEDLKAHFEIEEIEDFKHYIKGFNALTKFLDPRQNLKEGDVVRMTKGPYAEMVGLVKRVDMKAAEVEMSAWERIIKETIALEDIVKID